MFGISYLLFVAVTVGERPAQYAGSEGDLVPGPADDVGYEDGALLVVVNEAAQPGPHHYQLDDSADADEREQYGDGRVESDVRAEHCDAEGEVNGDGHAHEDVGAVFRPLTQEQRPLSEGVEVEDEAETGRD